MIGYTPPPRTWAACGETLHYNSDASDRVWWESTFATLILSTCNVEIGIIRREEGAVALGGKAGGEGHAGQVFLAFRLVTFLFVILPVRAIIG